MYQKSGRKFQQLQIGLASPKEIKSWAERFLPNGEILRKPEDYLVLWPEHA